MTNIGRTPQVLNLTHWTNSSIDPPQRFFTRPSGEELFENVFRGTSLDRLEVQLQDIHMTKMFGFLATSYCHIVLQTRSSFKYCVWTSGLNLKWWTNNRHEHKNLVTSSEFMFLCTIVIPPLCFTMGCIQLFLCHTTSNKQPTSEPTDKKGSLAA